MDATNIPLRRRDTPDLIVMWLAGVVAVILLVSLVGGIVWKINDPDADISELAARVGDITNTLIGAVVGYLAGRGVVAPGQVDAQSARLHNELEGGE
jgi:hypothetical protein